MTISIHLAKTKLHELANQVYILATGLQNAAPTGSPGKTIQYLLDAAVELEKTSQEIEKLLDSSTESQ